MVRRMRSLVTTHTNSGRPIYSTHNVQRMGLMVLTLGSGELEYLVSLLVSSLQLLAACRLSRLRQRHNRPVPIHDHGRGALQALSSSHTRFIIDESGHRRLDSHFPPATHELSKDCMQASPDTHDPRHAKPALWNILSVSRVTCSLISEEFIIPSVIMGFFPLFTRQDSTGDSGIAHRHQASGVCQ